MTGPADLPTDEHGRFVWLVSWGRLDRPRARAAVVLAYEADEARALARDAYPDRAPPDVAVLASPATAQAVVAGGRSPFPQLAVAVPASADEARRTTPGVTGPSGVAAPSAAGGAYGNVDRGAAGRLDGTPDETS